VAEARVGAARPARHRQCLLRQTEHPVGDRQPGADIRLVGERHLADEEHLGEELLTEGARLAQSPDIRAP